MAKEETQSGDEDQSEDDELVKAGYLTSLSTASPSKLGQKVVHFRSHSPNKRRVFWSEDEIEALSAGVKKYGRSWSKIRSQYDHIFDPGRTTIDLKDKWRNLRKQSEAIRDAADAEPDRRESSKDFSKLSTPELLDIKKRSTVDGGHLPPRNILEVDERRKEAEVTDPVPDAIGVGASRSQGESRRSTNSANQSDNDSTRKRKNDFDERGIALSTRQSKRLAAPKSSRNLLEYSSDDSDALTDEDGQRSAQDGEETTANKFKEIVEKAEVYGKRYSFRTSTMIDRYQSEVFMKQMSMFSKRSNEDSPVPQQQSSDKADRNPRTTRPRLEQRHPPEDSSRIDALSTTSGRARSARGMRRTLRSGQSLPNKKIIEKASKEESKGGEEQAKEDDEDEQQEVREAENELEANEDAQEEEEGDKGKSKGGKEVKDKEALRSDEDEKSTEEDDEVQQRRRPYAETSSRRLSKRKVENMTALYNKKKLRRAGNKSKLRKNNIEQRAFTTKEMRPEKVLRVRLKAVGLPHDVGDQNPPPYRKATISIKVVSYSGKEFEAKLPAGTSVYELKSQLSRSWGAPWNVERIQLFSISTHQYLQEDQVLRGGSSESAIRVAAMLVLQQPPERKTRIS